MLKKLGRQLTILNVLISGAILIVMAVAALGVTERMITVRNENDLLSQVGMVSSAIFMDESDSGPTRVKFTLPEKYSVYTSDPVLLAQFMLPSVMSDEDASVLLKGVAIKIDTQLGGTNVFSLDEAHESAKLDDEQAPAPEQTTDDEPTDEGKWQSKLIITTSVKSASESGITSKNAMFHTSPIVEEGLYRIAATKVVGATQEKGDVLMVMQDRTEELRERDNLRVLFAICVLGALALIVLSSLFFSAKAVAPVERMLKNQREFVAAASHELRTPIASVRANAEVLNDAELGDYEPFHRAILSESEKMTKLVSDLLCLARTDADEQPISAMPIEIADTARDALALMEPLAHRAGLRLEPSLQDAVMLGDQDRLRQIFIALMDNAVRYTPEGGAIYVTTGRRDQKVFIAVEDTGPGVPDEYKARIFDRFFRVDVARSREQGGSGLGLSIAKELVERMGGRITLGDREGGGCSVRIEFPRAHR